LSKADSAISAWRSSSQLTSTSPALKQQPDAVEADLVDVARVFLSGGQEATRPPSHALKVLQRLREQRALFLQPAVAGLGVDERLGPRC